MKELYQNLSERKKSPPKSNNGKKNEWMKKKNEWKNYI